MRDITKERVVYKTFEYTEAHDFWLKQHQAHWLHTEVPMMSDVNDWKQNLSETEKNIIGSIFYGNVLGIFLLAFFFTYVKSRAVFIAAIITQGIIVYIWWIDLMPYLWLNVVGATLVIAIAFILQVVSPDKKKGLEV